MSFDKIIVSFKRTSIYNLHASIFMTSYRRIHTFLSIISHSFILYPTYRTQPLLDTVPSNFKISNKKTPPTVRLEMHILTYAPNVHYNLSCITSPTSLYAQPLHAQRALPATVQPASNTPTGFFLPNIPRPRPPHTTIFS